jgi:hypothetical protein
MEERYEFSAAEVLPLIEEANDAGERLMTEAQRLVAAGVDLQAGEIPEDPVDHPGTGAPPGLWLMNDRGVYLRSNAEDGGEQVAYAHGFRSELPVGDEPMCEFVDAAPLAALRAGDTLVVTLDEHKIRLSLLREP